MNDVKIGKGNIQGKGIYAERDFAEGEIVIDYNLKPLSKNEYDKLPDDEKMFTHKHWGTIYLYSVPERYVNHASRPNTFQDLNQQCDVALRRIEKGEEITTDAERDDVE
jgi:hypothetical protein